MPKTNGQTHKSQLLLTLSSSKRSSLAAVQTLQKSCLQAQKGIAHGYVKSKKAVRVLQNTAKAAGQTLQKLCWQTQKGTLKHACYNDLF